MRMTWAVLPAALKIVRSVLLASAYITGLSEWQWPWKFWNAYFLIHDEENPHSILLSVLSPAFYLFIFYLEMFLFVSQLVFLWEKSNQRKDKQTKSPGNGSCEREPDSEPKSRLEVEEALWFVLVFSFSFFLSCLFGKHIVRNSVFSCCASFFSAPPLLFIWQPWLESLGSCLPACYKILHVLHIFEELLIWGDFFLSIFYAEHQSCFPRRLGKMQWCATQRGLFNSSNH